jgi:3'-phosphoadenosine 5'-phosphosulfate sulfotransferase (PAPS reductase)/FAD synthetase
LNETVEQADVIFVSHSGGKDSQAMMARLIALGLKDKLVVVHSDLGEMEWEPMHDFIARNAFGLEVHVVSATEDFFQLCRRTKRFPSGQCQYCTDNLKIIPISKFIHEYMTAHGFKNAINATGIRAEESERRAKKEALCLSEMTQPKKHPGHVIHDWLPIFNYTMSDVCEEILLAGQRPHEIYFKGFSRLSCVFCVNGRKNEHQKAAEMKPALFQKIVALEKELGKSYRLKTIDGVKSNKFMDEYCGPNTPDSEKKLNPKTVADLKKFMDTLNSFFVPSKK